MIANYHSHTTRCHHASGTQREFVETAIASGFRIWGFSDHTPYPFDNGYVSRIRMLPEELESYAEETLRLQREYRDQIEIHLGLEAEYYPRHFEALLRLCEGFPIEYLILGQHAVGEESDGIYSGFPTAEERVLAAYCDQVSAGLDTGCFLYVAHPDLINYTGDEKTYEKHIRPLCRKMKELGIPGEINLLGMLDHRNYPNLLFWRIAAEENVDAVIGVDAHHVRNISLPQCEKKATEIAEQLHLRLLPRLDLSSSGTSNSPL